jgi:hypothetical protein
MGLRPIEVHDRLTTTTINSSSAYRLKLLHAAQGVFGREINPKAYSLKEWMTIGLA